MVLLVRRAVPPDRGATAACTGTVCECACMYVCGGCMVLLVRRAVPPNMHRYGVWVCTCIYMCVCRGRGWGCVCVCVCVCLYVFLCMYVFMWVCMHARQNLLLCV